MKYGGISDSRGEKVDGSCCVRRAQEGKGLLVRDPSMGDDEDVGSKFSKEL